MKPGTKHSIVSLEKMHRAKCGENNPNFGKSRSASSKQKTSDSLKGHTISEETRKKISTAIHDGLPKYVDKLKRAWADPEKREARLEIMNTPAYKSKISASSKHFWSDPTNKESLSGPNSPNWCGGKSFEPYCVKFNESFKERVRAFFEYTCVLCGTRQNGVKLGVHHVNYNKQSCCDENVKPLFVPLCRGCHAKTSAAKKEVRARYEMEFTSMIQNYYDGKCYLTKEEFAVIPDAT
jgi:hypothetical protein